jgi:hypothetical protein
MIILVFTMKTEIELSTMALTGKNPCGRIAMRVLNAFVTAISRSFFVGTVGRRAHNIHAFESNVENGM